MRFFVLDEEGRPSSKRRACLLEPVPWPDDDYLTLYRLWFADGHGALVELGRVKIGYADLVRDDRPLRKGEFRQLTGLDRRLYWFSVGQDAAYYENVGRLGAGARREILEGLCDIAFSSEVFARAVFWDVTQTSLLRSVELQSVEGQFRRIARGGMRLTAYHFDYVAPADTAAQVRRLSFSVTPHSRPPTNIHVLIGRNGVGKTTLLANIGKAVVNPDADDVGEVAWSGAGSGSFTNVVSVTFSAFDPAQDDGGAQAGGDDDDHRQVQGWDGAGMFPVTRRPRQIRSCRPCPPCMWAWPRSMSSDVPHASASHPTT